MTFFPALLGALLTGFVQILELAHFLHLDDAGLAVEHGAHPSLPPLQDARDMGEPSLSVVSELRRDGGPQQLPGFSFDTHAFLLG
jgi:hypothetical protein